ncbi:MAG: hypothetical protein H6523_15175 [Mycolicibacterium sp.]|nr:hypothetical protein [Mycolicibacterium sp.]
MKNIIYGIIGIMMGIGLFIGGISSLGSSEVTCGDKTMHQGQQCTHISRAGSTLHNDYDTEKSNGRNGDIFMLVAGPFMIIVGAAIGYSGLTQRRKALPRIAATAPGPLPPAGPPPAAGYTAAPTAGFSSTSPTVSTNPYDYSRPFELACVLDANIVMKRMTSLFVILALVVWLVAAVALGLMFPDITPVWLGGSFLVAAATAAAAYIAKRNQLRRQYGQLQRLILHPGGLRRFDPWVVIDISWTDITAITWRNSALGSPSRVHRTGAAGAATNAAIAQSHTVMASGITGTGTIAPLPGASTKILQIQDGLYGSQLARGYPFTGPDCVIFPAEFEHDWTHGIVGAWLHHYRPDMTIPAAPPTG